MATTTFSKCNRPAKFGTLLYGEKNGELIDKKSQLGRFRRTVSKKIPRTLKKHKNTNKDKKANGGKANGEKTPLMGEENTDTATEPSEETTGTIKETEEMTNPETPTPASGEDEHADKLVDQLRDNDEQSNPSDATTDENEPGNLQKGTMENEESKKPKKAKKANKESKKESKKDTREETQNGGKANGEKTPDISDANNKELQKQKKTMFGKVRSNLSKVKKALGPKKKTKETPNGETPNIPDSETAPEQYNETVAVTAPETVDESNTVKEYSKETGEKNADPQETATGDTTAASSGEENTNTATEATKETRKEKPPGGANNDGNEPATSEVENGQDVNDTEKKADKDGDTSKTAESQKDPTGDKTTPTGVTAASSSGASNGKLEKQKTETVFGKVSSKFKKTLGVKKKTKETPNGETTNIQITPPVTPEEPASGEDNEFLHDQSASGEDEIFYDALQITPPVSPEEPASEEDEYADKQEQTVHSMTVQDEDDGCGCCCTRVLASFFTWNPTKKKETRDLESQTPPVSSAFLYY